MDINEGNYDNYPGRHYFYASHQVVRAHEFKEATGCFIIKQPETPMKKNIYNWQ